MLVTSIFMGSTHSGGQPWSANAGAISNWNTHAHNTHTNIHKLNQFLPKKMKFKNSCQCKYSARVEYNYLFFVVAHLKKGVWILGQCKYAGVVSHQRFLWGPAWEAKIADAQLKMLTRLLFGGRYIGENNHRWCVSPSKWTRANKSDQQNGILRNYFKLDTLQIKHSNNYFRNYIEPDLGNETHFEKMWKCPTFSLLCNCLVL